MDDMSEYQDTLQNSTSDVNGADNIEQLGTITKCDCCNAEFMSNASFITICPDCRNSIQEKVIEYDQNNEREKVSETSTTPENSNESAENTDATKIATSSNDGILRGLDLYLENPETFAKDHSHYLNPVVDSTNSLYNILADKASSNESLNINFNSSLIIANEESSVNGYGKDKHFFYFLANSENSGDYEHRTYYGYDCLVAIATKSNKKGYICPSIIVEITEDGKRVDTGQRLLRLLRTRCIHPEIHAIVYDIHQDSVFFVKKMFLTTMHKKSRYTICHLPFKYDTIKEKLETFININRLVYDPDNRPGISRDCKYPAMADWKILKMKEAPPDNYKAGEWKEILKAMRDGSEEEIMEVDNDEDEEDFETVSVSRPKRLKKAPVNYIDAAIVPTPKSAKAKKVSKNKKSQKQVDVLNTTVVKRSVITPTVSIGGINNSFPIPNVSSSSIDLIDDDSQYESSIALVGRSNVKAADAIKNPSTSRNADAVSDFSTSSKNDYPEILSALKLLVHQNESMMEQTKRRNECQDLQYEAQQTYNSNNDKRMDIIESKLQSLLSSNDLQKPNVPLSFLADKPILSTKGCYGNQTSNMDKNVTGLLLATLFSKQEKENKMLRNENDELKKNDLYEALKIMF